ncbi:TPA: ImmA/IrrE family metallo-endopeptidase [Campylobacter fetus subsp. venerealis]|nr:ImmA/IrrE family metallo-endopeptidase [Campylobacter fetus subsp. venerealis]HDX6324081.1 ImmA/IrrE family metallo-endopeptidase [Campylobacter fetus subsp. venerealis]
MSEYLGAKETEIFNVILEELGDKEYIKFQSKGNFSDLSVDKLGSITLDGKDYRRIALAHNSIENGDVMADPDMEFAILKTQDSLEIIPLTYQNDYTETYDTAFLKFYSHISDLSNNTINKETAKKLAEFANMWLNNLNEQQGILEHKYSLVDVEGNAIDSKFKQNFAFLDDDTFPQELEIQKISITNDVKKVAKGDDYPEYFANFTQGEKGLFNFGVFAAQNGISPTTVAKFLKTTSGRGSKSNKEGIAGAFYRDDLGDITLSYYALKKVKDIEPKDLKDLIENGKVIDVKVADYTGNITLTLQKDDFAITLFKNMDENYPNHDFDFQSITKIHKQENTMPSADYTKRQNETNDGAYSRTKNNYNANYGNYGARQNHAQQEQGGFNQTTQNTATQTANTPQGAEQGGYKSRQQYASKSYKSPKSEKTEQLKTTEKPNLYELAKQSSLEVDKSIEILSKQLKDPKTKEVAMEAMTRYLEQFNSLHNYSARNIMLAMKQGKERGIEVSRLGSYDSWKELKGTEKDKDGNLKEVSVLKGEKGLSILVPVFKDRFMEQRDLDKNAKNPFALVLDENGQKIPLMQKTKNEKGEIVEVQRKELAYFSLGKVFDISQTNAYEIGAVKKPSKIKVGEFDGQITDFTLQTIAEKITKTYGIEVNFGALSRAARGFYQQHDDGRKEIFIDNRHLSESSQMATLFHELGHAVMNHSYAKDGVEKAEVQAEVFAFVLSRKFGLETTSAEFISAYIANVENSDEFFKLVEPVRKEVVKAYEKLNLQSEFEKLVSAKEAYEENAKFKEEAEAERIAQGKLYSFETNFDNIDPDDDSAMNEIREKAKQEQAKEQEKDSHNLHNKQRDKNRP